MPDELPLEDDTETEEEAQAALPLHEDDETDSEDKADEPAK